jgi:hypothetical protein
VDEHDRPSTAELVEERVVGGVAEIGAVDVGQQDHAVGVQLVEGVGRLLEGRRRRRAG